MAFSRGRTRAVQRTTADGGAPVSWQAGSASYVLERLLADPATADLDPVLMTARTVACAPGAARRLVRWLREADPDLEVDDPESGTDQSVVHLGGRWSARRWVPLVTRFFEEGECRVLVGTRGLLGEGWDAKRVCVVIDLTVATTPTSVVQTRGRALRLDPDWPEKVATTWTVVTVTDRHPKGAADYARFVAKHEGFFAPDAEGLVVSGVAHVDEALSPYAPPPVAEFDALNAGALVRAEDRRGARERWRVGEPFEDVAVRTVRVTAGRSMGLTGAPLAGLVRARDLPGRSRRSPLAVAASGGGALAGVVGAQVGGLGGTGTLLTAGGLGLLGGAGGRAVTSRRMLAGFSECGALHALAHAVADGLRDAGLSPVGAAAVVVEPGPDGSYAASLREVDEATSALFGEALDEVVSPLAAPRYVVSRLVVDPPGSPGAAWRLAVRRGLRVGVPASEVWHAVPSVLGVNRKRADAFVGAWRRYVSPARLLYTGSPEGEGVLLAQRGDDPFAVTTRMRTVWR